MKDDTPTGAAGGQIAQGIGLMALAVAVFSVMGLLVKLIGPDYHAAQAVFFRNGVAAFVVVPFLLRAGGPGLFRTARPWGHAGRAVFGVLGVACYFYSFQHLPLATAVTLSLSVPIITALMAVVILKEVVGWRRWSAILVGFIGVIVALDPGAPEGIDPAGLVALVGTLFWAAALISIRSLSHTESSYTIVFYYMVAGSLLASLALPWVWKTPTPDVLAMYVLLGFVGAAGQLLMTASLRRAPASVVSPIEYSHVVWAGLFDIFVWGVAPSATTALGAAIVIGAGLYIFHREARAG